MSRHDRREDIIKVIQEDKLFGIIEWDNQVPNHSKGIYFLKCHRYLRTSRFPGTILATTSFFVTIMSTFATENGLMNHSRRSMIGSMVGQKTMLIPPLLKWYINHGLLTFMRLQPASSFGAFRNKSGRRTTNSRHRSQQIKCG